MNVADETAYAGIWTALATPFFEDGRIDWESFERLLTLQAAAGVTGLVIAGATGEGTSLAVQEKLSLLRKARVVVGDQLMLMIGSGGQSTEQTVELSKLALDAGADALLVVTPPYIKPNPSGLRLHFQTIAQQTGAPVCIYHNPARTNQRLSAQTMADLCREPRVCMIKEASGDMALFSETQILADAVVLSGDDATFLPSLAVGGRGSISTASNLFPREMVTMQKLFEAGRVQQALAIHEALLPAIQVLFCETNPCPLKAALAHRQLAQNHFRLPLAPVSAANDALIADTLFATQEKLAALDFPLPL